jgi:transcription elongation factor Elf1
MNITKSTTSVTCPHCGHKSTYDMDFRELADGGKLACGKCGKEIPFDKRVFDALIGELPTSNLFNMTTTTKSSMSFQCPRCQKTTTTDMTIDRLVDGEKVFCSHCGNEIHADGEKIIQADAALRGLATPPGASDTKTLDTPGGPVAVKTKTFSFNVKTNINVERPAGGVGTTAGGTPILTPRRAIEPKKGCLGVVTMFVLLAAAVLIYGFVV